MRGNSAASRLAHLYPELAFLGGAGLDQGVVVSAPGAAGWEAGQLQAWIGAADIVAVHGGTEIRFAGLALASPPDLHRVSTRPAMPLHVRGHCLVA
jgi:hypothetical protein